ISRLPSAAASRNMSACSAHAMSQVGCRLMVASSANTSRPLAPAAYGDIPRALATKAAISSAVDDLVSGSEPALPVLGAELTSPDLGLVGSPDISARNWQQALCGLRPGKRQCAEMRRASTAHAQRPGHRPSKTDQTDGQFGTGVAGGLTGTNGETGPGSLKFATAPLVSTGART